MTVIDRVSTTGPKTKLLHLQTFHLWHLSTDKMGLSLSSFRTCLRTFLITITEPKICTNIDNILAHIVYCRRKFNAEKVSQKCAAKLMALTLSNLNRFSKFFNHRKDKFHFKKHVYYFLPHLRYVAALPVLDVNSSNLWHLLLFYWDTVYNAGKCH